MAGKWGDGSGSGGRIANKALFSPQAPFITNLLVMKLSNRYFKACMMLGVGSERAAFEVWMRSNGLGMRQEGWASWQVEQVGWKEEGDFFFFSLSYCISINQETSFMSLQLGQIFQIIVNCGSHQTAGYSSEWSIIETSQNTAAVRCSSISKRVVMSWCSLPAFMVIVKKINKHSLFQQLGLVGAWYPKLAELRWSCAPPEIK